jgi:hypothetical protein
MANILALKPTAERASVDGSHLLLQAKPSESWHRITPFLERASVGGAG